MVLKPLTEFLELFNKDHKVERLDYYGVCYFTNTTKESLENRLEQYSHAPPLGMMGALCHEAKLENTPQTIVSYKEGCGKWLNTAKGCPFSNAAGLVSEDMTPNERSVIELWDKMVPVYSAVV
jgi:hypothetical protein